MRNIHAVVPLLISLLEELLIQQVCPVFESIEAARWRRQVTRMNHQIKALLLRFKRLYVISCVDEVSTVARLLCNVLFLNLEVHYIDMAKVISHISSENHADHALAQELFLIATEGLHKVVFVLQQQLHRPTRMPILLHSLVMVADGAIRHEIDMV